MLLFVVNSYGNAVLRQCIVVHSILHQRSVSVGGTGSLARKDGDCEWWG